MATDDERRRVAAELRGMHDYETPIPIIRTCLGLRPGMLMDNETRRRMSDRLADLIYPDTTTNTTKSPDITTKCDREALLALAEEMAVVTCDNRGELSISLGDVHGLARRIREACGEVGE